MKTFAMKDVLSAALVADVPCKTLRNIEVITEKLQLPFCVSDCPCRGPGAGTALREDPVV